MKGKFLVMQLLCCFLLCTLPSRAAAIMIGLSTEELTRSSETVIMGEVEDVQSHWSKDGTTIITRATVRIGEVVRGRLSQQKVVVEYAGGVVGDIGMRVSDMAALENGEKVLLFLKSGQSLQDGDIHEIVGKAQGKYKIDAQGMARKMGFGLAAGHEKIDNDIPVEELKNKIKTVK